MWGTNNWIVCKLFVRTMITRRLLPNVNMEIQKVIKSIFKKILFLDSVICSGSGIEYRYRMRLFLAVF